MTTQRPAQRDGSSLVEQHSQAVAPPSPGRSRNGQAALSVFEHGLDVLAGHAGEPLKEIVDSRPAFQILEKRLHRHPRALKQPGAAHLTRHALNRRTFAPIEHGVKIRRAILVSKHDRPAEAPRERAVVAITGQVVSIAPT